MTWKQYIGRNMITTCNMKMYVHILFRLQFYMKRECKKKHTRRPNSTQNIWCTKEKQKETKNLLTMKTKQDHQINIIHNHIIPINYYSNYTANSNQSITLFYIT